MAFRFGLESVLRHRKRSEDIAQREFAEAQAAVDVVLRQIEGMYVRLDEVREEVNQVQKTLGKSQLASICELESFIVGHKLNIEKKRKEARALLELAEQKQEALIFCAQEKKVLVKLKEKRLTEYKNWLGRIEAKALDDQTQMRQAWRKR